MAINHFDLIFDRTQADVDYALMFERESIHTDEDLRGAYNTSDRNRVANSLNYLTDILRRNGYEHMGCVKADWKEGDIVKADDNAETLKNLKESSRVLSQISLEIPDNLDYLSYQKANAVEKILFDMLENYDRLSDAWLYCGEGYSGELFEEHKLDDWWEI